MKFHPDIQRVQFVGGPLDGEEIDLPKFMHTFSAPHLSRDFDFREALGLNTDKEIDLEEDIYEQLLDSPIYVYKLTRKK